MRAVRRPTPVSVLMFVALVFMPLAVYAQPVEPCARPAEGSLVAQPPDLYSRNGTLSVRLGYYTRVDRWGRNLFCFQTSAGSESPTLHVNPGDTLRILLTNLEPQPPDFPLREPGIGKLQRCEGTMTAQSVNMHFHGLNISPRCHGDEVVNTLINPGQTFEYSIKIPADETPGLNWYHPHIHGIAAAAVDGGASGAIEVEGIAKLQPAVEGLPQRFLVIRDQPLAYPPTGDAPGSRPPSEDISINYVPVSYPNYVPAKIEMHPGALEFWRVVNASADTAVDLRLVFDGKDQTVQIVAHDGVPTGSHNGRGQGTLISTRSVYIPPAGREEFIVVGPEATVAKAQLITKRVDTGPMGDIDVARPIATIQLTNSPKNVPPRVAPTTSRVTGTRFDGLTDSMVTARRKLYFSEKRGDPNGFFITVEGQKPKHYDPDDPPSIVTTRGAVEDWTIENRTREIHAFHIHQIHFKLLEVNGAPGDQQFWDTFPVDYWTGSGPYPYIKIRMDFRGAVVGEFVYHCHILDHEDGGMMANIRVLPKTPAPLSGP